MLKKFAAIVLTCIMMVAVLTACSEGHAHKATGGWEVDANAHWKKCSDCTGKAEEGPHKLNDESVCTVCGSEVYDFDESKALYLFNESGAPLKIAEYDKDGNVITEVIYAYKYDADGNLVRSKETTNGVITAENEYMLVDGEAVVSKFIGYMEDGTKLTNEYDSNGNVIRLVSYDAEGNMESQLDSEYKQLDDGEWYESKCTALGADGTKEISEYDQYGHSISVISYDAEGNVESEQTWERTYDDAGNTVSEKYYYDGVLVSECLYKTVEFDDGTATYPETVTEYQEDGGKTVTVYNENDEVVSETRYDADGNVIS